jgi:hypothetical protein
MLVLESVAVIQRLQRLRAMNLPAIDDFNEGELPDLAAAISIFEYKQLPLPADPSLLAPDARPAPTKTAVKWVEVSGLKVRAEHPSGVYYDSENHTIAGKNVSNMLGMRVLRKYLHPTAVAAREKARQESRADAWKALRPIDNARLLGWAQCGYCWEKNWCVIVNPDETPRVPDEIVCEECFFEQF